MKTNRSSPLAFWLMACFLMLSTGFSFPASAANKPPTVSLTAPSNGATFTSPANITLTASASDSDGTVSKVEFYNGTTLLGSSTTSPYSMVWSNVSEGSYTLTAKATDNKGASTTSASVTITVNAPFNNGPINLVYDELGRVVGLSDATGASATYNYDALGNIVSIGRTGINQVSISEFTPNSGPVGSTVTISGDGFSATPSQNTVKFNGTTATISAASTTQLVAQVPTGATTGLISVTAPNGSATSSTAFTVSDSNAPAITNIVPTIGPVGTAVTISGSHFQTVLSNNNVAFNTRPAVVTSATASSLTTSIGANATSGKVSVTTPYGKAVSSQDFYVVPSPYTAADIEVANRMAIGDSPTVTISGAGKKALVIFDAVAGQRIGLQATNSSFASCVNVQLTRPDGFIVYSGCMATGSFIDPPPLLPYNGTYTVFINPTNSQTGSITLALLSAPPDVTGTITVDGAPVTVTTTMAGQNASLTFNGSAGQRVTLQAIASTYNGWVDVYIYNPAADGSASTSNGVFYQACCWGSGNLTDLLTLPMAGTYTIVLNPWGAVTGSMTLKLPSVPPDVTGTIAVDGAPVTVTTAVAQNASLTFSGSAGQRVTLQSISSTYNGWVDVYIYNPAADGSASTSNGVVYQACCWGSGNLTDQLTLPAAGTYTIVVNPEGAVTGSMTLKLLSVPPDVTGTITVDGAPVTVTTALSQNANLTFSGSTGQRVALQSTSSTYNGWVDVFIYNPAADGSASTSNGVVYQACCWGSGNLTDLLTLPAAGTYTIVVNPEGAVTGSMTLKLLSVPPDVTGTITVNGPAVTVTTTAPVQNASLSFSGSAGQSVALQSTSSTYPGWVNVFIYPPAADGSASTNNGTLYQWCCWNGNTSTGSQTLPSTGVYTILVDPSGMLTGSMVLNLSSQ